MKKLILAVLIVLMVTTPCLAQEIETDGLFSLERTLWRYFRPDVFVTTRPLPLSIDILVSSGEIGFYQGSVYWCSENGCRSGGSYIDTPVLGIYYDIFAVGLVLYVMQPTAGIGLTTIVGYGGSFRGTQFVVGLGIMFKTDNNWTPPSE